MVININILLRTLYGLTFFTSIIFFPWWVTLFAGVVGMMLFSRYWEALFFGVFMDILYADPGGGFLFQFPFLYTGFFLFCFILFGFVKSRLLYF